MAEEPHGRRGAGRTRIDVAQPLAGTPRLTDAARQAEREVLRPERVALLLTVTALALFAVCILLVATDSVLPSGRLAAAPVWVYPAVVVALAAGVFFAAARVILRGPARATRRLLRRRDELLRLERRAMAGTFAAAVAHDIRNVLTVALANLGDLADDPDLRPVSREKVDLLASSTADLVELTGRLHRAGLEGAPGLFERTDPAAVVRDAVQLSSYHPAARACEVRVQTADLGEMECQPHLLRQAVVNLVVNASQAAGAGGQVAVSVRSDEGEMVIEVEDSGPGVAEAERLRIFEPFVTSKSEGMGLGLLSVKSCAEIHGGRVEARDSAMGGARFALRVPLDRPPPGERGPTGPRGSFPDGGNGDLLLGGLGHPGVWARARR